LDGFVAITGAIGAAIVIPYLPTDLYRYKYFTDFTVPASALGALAAVSTLALCGLLLRRRFGRTLSALAGASLVIFEVVESAAVGSVFTPPPGLELHGEMALWLQPLYIAVGLAMVLLAGSPPVDMRLPTKAIALALITLTVVAGSAYAWAAASTGNSIYARFIAWGEGTTYDWTRFPERSLPASRTPDHFVASPIHTDLRAATASSNPDQFFGSSETTALLALQHGRLVLERYYNGADRSSRITAFSMTKSWDSAMVGAAIAAGYIRSVDDPVTTYIPELSRKDARFNALTLRELLMQRSGLGLNTSGWPLNDDSVLYNSTALRKAVLDRAHFIAAPGTTFFYNDFNPMLIGIVLERATGRTVTQWLEETLWAPMGAQYPGSIAIDSVAGGFEKVEAGLSGTPIDLIRLGQLYLQGGNWYGRQLVPSDWVAMTTDYATSTDTGMWGAHYAMMWWTRIVDGVRVFFAWGNHGEYVLVAPSLDIVVARFGRQYGLGAPLYNSGGGEVGHEKWPQVLTRIATSIAAARP
jgi:CubicO group peptidase (beta-lactamase class C family)